MCVDMRGFWVKNLITNSISAVHHSMGPDFFSHNLLLIVSHQLFIQCIISSFIVNCYTIKGLFIWNRCFECKTMFVFKSYILVVDFNREKYLWSRFRVFIIIQWRYNPHDSRQLFVWIHVSGSQITDSLKQSRLTGLLVTHSTGNGKNS